MPSPQPNKALAASSVLQLDFSLPRGVSLSPPRYRREKKKVLAGWGLFQPPPCKAGISLFARFVSGCGHPARVVYFPSSVLSYTDIKETRQTPSQTENAPPFPRNERTTSVCDLGTRPTTSKIEIRAKSCTALNACRKLRHTYHTYERIFHFPRTLGNPNRLLEFLPRFPMRLRS